MKCGARSPFSTVGEHKDLHPVQIVWAAFPGGKAFQIHITPIDPNQRFAIPVYLECVDFFLTEIRKEYAKEIADYYADKNSDKIVEFKPRGKS
jgi:hypothetical protein